MEQEEMHRTLVRIAHEILERNKGSKDLALIGIKRRGNFIAERLKKEIESIENSEVLLGAIDITLYRDDLQLVASAPIIHGSEINFDVTDKIVILVDDVIFTGRTIRAAISEILDFGRPKGIQLAVFVDKGHRELPICADYVGIKISAQKNDIVDIFVEEEDEKDGVFLTERT